jgi:hypothetical protein
MSQYHVHIRHADVVIEFFSDDATFAGRQISKWESNFGIDLPEPAPIAAVASPVAPAPEPVEPDVPSPVATPVEPAQAPALVAAPPADAEKDDFEAVLNTLMADLNEEEPPKKTGSGGGLGHIESLEDLVDRVQPANPQQFLLLAAYFLTYFEAEEKFSLKRINSLMVKSALSAVNYGTLEGAVSAGLLDTVPDMTGTAEVSEYALTAEGRAQVEKLF